MEIALEPNHWLSLPNYHPHRNVPPSDETDNSHVHKKGGIYLGLNVCLVSCSDVHATSEYIYETICTCTYVHKKGG